MWVAVLLTVLASAGNNIGKVLQKKGTKGLPRLSLEWKVLSAYLSSRTWLTGFVVDVGGALLMLVAVSKAPVSVVQPVSGSGLAILAVFSHFYLHETMGAGDWVGIGLLAMGTIGIGLSGEEAKETEVSLLRLVLFVVWTALLLGIMDRLSVTDRQRRRSLDLPGLQHSAATMDVMEELAVGTQAGACFGLSAAVSRTGFVLAEGHHFPLAIPMGIAVSISLTSGGFFCQTRGLKEGRAVVVSTVAAVGSIVTGVLVGMVALGEPLPRHRVTAVVRVGGWLLIVAGIVLLLGSSRKDKQDDEQDKPAKPLTLRRLMRSISTRFSLWRLVGGGPPGSARRESNSSMAWTPVGGERAGGGGGGR